MGTFLIADDSPEKMRFLLQMLKRAKWEGDILTAVTSEEAFEKIDHAVEIAAAFIDYYIPSKNGPAIIRSLKAKFPEAHVALVSSAESAKNTAEAKTAGAEAVICTTWRSDEVERAILEMLEVWKQI